jgi:1-acyl-sn-glycerol-3-phosphate acyltransferase
MLARVTGLMAEPADLDIAWTRSGPASRLRELLICGVLGPLMDVYTRRRIAGRERLDELSGPVIFVANHNSHMDTPVILRALPRRWRRHTAVTAATDYFYGKRRNAVAASLVFGTMPLDRNSGAGVGPAQTAHLDRHISEGGSLLIFPEGTRSREGDIGKIKSGAAVLAAQHNLNIVPIWVGGTHDAMPPGQNWPKRRRGRLLPRRHQVEVRFGEPIPPRDPAQRREVMAEVQAFWERKGLPEDGRDPSEIHDVLLIHEVLRIHEAAAGRERTGRFDKVIPLATEPVPDQPSPAA